MYPPYHATDENGLLLPIRTHWEVYVQGVLKLKWIFRNFLQIVLFSALWRFRFFTEIKRGGVDLKVFIVTATLINWIKVSKQGETAFHGGRADKKNYLKLWRLSSLLTQLMIMLMILVLNIRRYTTMFLCTEKKNVSPDNQCQVV